MKTKLLIINISLLSALAYGMNTLVPTDPAQIPEGKFELLAASLNSLNSVEKLSDMQRDIYQCMQNAFTKLSANPDAAEYFKKFNPPEGKSLYYSPQIDYIATWLINDKGERPLSGALESICILKLQSALRQGWASYVQEHKNVRDSKKAS
jgi:hypothetical protein